MNMKKNTFMKITIMCFTLTLVTVTILISIKLLKKEEVPQVKTLKNDYIKLNDRDSYVLKSVTSDLLTNYLDSERTLVVFSASWCKYCVEEKENLNNFILNNPDKTIIIVSHDRNYNDIQQYLTENNLNWFVIYDTNKTILQSIDPESNKIPSFYLLDKDGNLIHKEIGVLSYEEIQELYQKII